MLETEFGLEHLAMLYQGVVGCPDSGSVVGVHAIEPDAGGSADLLGRVPVDPLDIVTGIDGAPFRVGGPNDVRNISHQRAVLVFALADGFFGPFAPTDVAGDDRRADHFIRGVPNRGYGERDIDRAAGFPGAHRLEMGDFLSAFAALKILLHLTLKVRRRQGPNLLPSDISGLIAEQLRRSQLADSDHSLSVA